ncbi:uncharacterized protein LOC100650703 isoform X2 [Bombus terrestris]|uniref:Uncharacterized protein LOC100650703 isoform X2 n=1 Tax=Bombus terrestris TaxID=30195 RepID=A0A9B7I0H7_BOMTE|nr:uncharacterized protein LOC100650703 isoform X2 [Bombus terrestris]
MCMSLKSKNHCFSWIEVLEVAMEFMKENGTSACGERESGAISVNEETPSRVDQQVLFPVQNTFTSMGIAYACSVVAMLAVILLTVEAGDMMRKSIVFDKNTPDVFYCPQQKPTGFQKMIVNAKPLSRLCQFEGKPIPPDYKSDCYNDVDETEYACKEKYRIMKRFRNKAEGDENTVDDYGDK